MATYTANSLLKSTQSLASWRGPGYANVELVFMRTVPFAGTKSLVFHWRAKPSPLKRNKDGSMPKNAKKPSWYDVYLEFQDVNYANEGDEIPSDNTWSSIEYNGEKYYYEKPRIDKNRIRIRCSCGDFTFRFAKECYDAGLLYGGTWKRYQRKTEKPPLGRPEVNPNHVPGFCKHIYAAIVRSITEGWILGGSV